LAEAAAPSDSLFCFWAPCTNILTYLLYLTYKFLPHYLGKCKTVIFKTVFKTISIKQLYFSYFHSIYHFQTANHGISLDYFTVSVQSDIHHSARIAAASGSEKDCIPSAHCVWADRI